MFYDTIAAPATKNIQSAVSVIRLSGENAVAIGDTLFGGKLSKAADRSLVYGKIRDKDGNILDDCLAVKMLAPKSYTGEDTVEFYCHGGKTVTECVMRELLKNGARLAEKGEFTKRAFLNGKMDLTQAEAVIDAIGAETKSALLMAQENLDGKLRHKIDGLRSRIMTEIMHILAGNDFPDETGGNHNDVILSRLEVILKDISSLLTSYDKGKILKDGFTAAICGKPNVGKSSLLNAILEEDRAIVTDIEGTTRDVITERIDIGGYMMNIADTAGLRESSDIVEQAGILKSYQYIEQVDYILYLLDASKELDAEETEYIKKLPSHTVVIYNKTDLNTPKIPDDFGKKVYCISAKNNEGISELLDGIKEDIEARLEQSESEETLFSERHYQALLMAEESLTRAISTLKMNLEADICSIDLEDAASYLGEITGTTVNDEVIDNIFKNFCIGK
ncbi:MAG: tRNA uridine-5-carboxymethylaminomethyl(34) synthesis GTPase MnmE [Ruminococcaceae bacterium]|nr:tRNA uridine-5-carboxymethylaminomethyl(34) synthesis GTPase MnmE [Oscillospiraceae bacterium]